MENKTIPGSIPNLFLASDIIITNVEKRLVKFTELKTSYSVTFIEGLRSELQACENLPDEASRALWHRQARTNVISSGDDCLALVRRLKRYVYTAFPVNTSDYYRAMGLTEYYAAAANSSWESMKALCTASIKFVADYSQELIANQNMKPDFEQQLTDTAGIFNQKLGIFYQKESLSKTAAASRMTACGNFYKKIISCCLDGQYIFENDDTVSKEYSYEAVTQMISPPTAAGLIVEASRDSDGVKQPMPGVEISIIGTDKKGVTNASGTTEFSQLPETSLKIRAKADGFQDLIFDIDTEAGVTKRLKIVMVPLFEGSMTVGAEAAATQSAATVPVNS
ncbi:MAG: hypothetical protein ABIT08_04090 [Bacteroidia bacterium]